jgi:2-C-methyl-D-erythritol 2,4-cyclodiphosphate synthase
MIRIGQGFDVHRFTEGKSVILCGVEIEHDKKLEGWSDADCPVHALMDAILGACGMVDIGHFFPPGDMRFKGASSLELLKTVMKTVGAKGYKFGNCDITIMAERPKIGPHIDEMKKALADVIMTDVDNIGIKATTTEKLGFCGREEGIAALAVVLMTKD